MPFLHSLLNTWKLIRNGRWNNRHSISPANAKLADGVIEGLLAEALHKPAERHGLRVLLHRQSISEPSGPRVIRVHRSTCSSTARNVAISSTRPGSERQIDHTLRRRERPFRLGHSTAQGLPDRLALPRLHSAIQCSGRRGRCLLDACERPRRGRPLPESPTGGLNSGRRPRQASSPIALVVAASLSSTNILPTAACGSMHIQKTRL
jgi:hypothetical protein